MTLNSVQLKYVSFVVADMERSLHFYRTLGLPIAEGAHLNASGEAEGHVEVNAHGLRIAWESEALMRELFPGWTPPSGAGRLAVAFGTGSVAEVDAVCEQLESAGFTVKAPPYDAPWGQRYATLQDPDGTPIDVFAWLPGHG
ncbi:VOC family protein [Deinococcus sp.]|uniref:VOC family protein n=1 Tax=Deinococcus sp. TaxID=47478 RepID=UPI003C7DDC31